MGSRLTNVLSLTGNGLRDWMIQRVTAVILGVYIIFLAGFVLMHSGMQYTDWQGLFAHAWMRVFTILALLSIFLHAWVGMWTVATDYIKITWLRLCFNVAVIVALFSYFIWGVQILWSS